MSILVEHDVEDHAESASIGVERVDWIALACLSLFSLLIVGLMGLRYTTLSPIDELQHIDYAIKVSQFDFVSKNERIGQEALHEAACRSVDAPGYVSPICDLSVTHNPGSFQERGVNTASSSNPPYYFVSGVIGRAIKKFTPIDSVVSGIRLSGAFWMTSAFAAVWLLMAELGIRRVQRAVAIGLMTATPTIFFGYSTVNTDNIILLASSLFALATLRYERGRFPGWALLLAAVATIGVEVTNVLVVLAAATYLLARALFSTERSKSMMGIGAVLALAPVPLVRVLSKVHEWIITPHPTLDFDLPRNTMFAADPGYVTTNLLISRLEALITPISQPYIPALLRGQITSSLLHFTGWILIGTVAAAVLTSHSRSRVSLLCSSAVGWLLVAGPLFTIHWSDTTLPIPARYGLPLLPLLLVGTAWVLRKRAALWSVGAFAAYGNVYMLFRLITAA